MILSILPLIPYVVYLLDREEQMRFSERYHDAKVAQWRPASAYDLPAEKLHLVATAVAGTWHMSGHLDGASLNFVPVAKASYSVFFDTSGCLGEWRARRTARFEAGVIRLDRPVETYSGSVFDRLFFVERNGTLALLPAGAVERPFTRPGPPPGP